MKKIFFVLAMLASLSLSAQDIISETQSIIARTDTIICDGDTISPVYYLILTQVIDNGTAYPDTVRSTRLIKSGETCPADSAEVAQQVYNAAINRQQEIAYYVGLSFQRQQYLADFNNSSGLYQSVTGLALLDATSETLFPAYSGKYRVFTATGNFFADIIRVGNGRWRLRQLTALNGTPTGVIWVLNPRSVNNFGLSNIDLGFGAQNYEFFRDKRNGAENFFWPAQRVSGATGAVRIVKVLSVTP